MLTETAKSQGAARAVIPTVRSFTLPALSPCLSLISSRMKVHNGKVTQAVAPRAAATPHTALLLEQMGIHACTRVSAHGHWSA